MKHFVKTLLAASTLVAFSGTAMAEDMTQAKSPNLIQIEVNFDRSLPAAETYKSLEIKVRAACRKAYRKTTRTYKNRAVFDCQKALMEKAVQVSKMPTLLAYHNDHTGPG